MDLAEIERKFCQRPEIAKLTETRRRLAWIEHRKKVVNFLNCIKGPESPKGPARALSGEGAAVVKLCQELNQACN